MSSSSAQRMERYRARQRHGRIVVPVEIDDTTVIEALIEARFLRECQRDDRVAIAKAIQAFLQVAARDA